MRKILAFLILMIPAVASGAMLTGKTPSNFNIGDYPDWLTVRTQDFESGSCPSDEACTSYGAAITTTLPHTGARSMQGTFAADQSSVAWVLSEGVTGSFNEIYVSYYEYVESQALFNDEWVIGRFQAPVSSSVQDIIYDFMWAPTFNNPSATLYMVSEGEVTQRWGGKYGPVPKADTAGAVGGWHQWEIHLRPNTPGQADGFSRVYLDGALFTSTENKELFGPDARMANTYVSVGGFYTKIVWMTDYPTCSVPSGCSPGPWTGTDLCVVEKGWVGQSFSNPRCNPIDPPLPNFKRFIDDIIVVKYGGDAVPPPTGDTSPPYVTGQSPAAGATNIPATTRTTTATVGDYGYGVNQSSIHMSIGKNGGMKSDYYCGTGGGLTCTGTSAAYTITRTATADYLAGDVVQVTINASDLSSPPNAMTPYSYSYTITAAGAGGPYPQSTVILGVNWNFSSVIQTAVGSDLWPFAWAGDNNLYANFGDGGGIGGDDTKCRTTFGTAKFTGTPTSLGGTNVYGCKSTGEGCSAGATHDAACDAPYASAHVGYSENIIAIDNTLYADIWKAEVPPAIHLIKSTDFAHTWTDTGVSWPQNPGTWHPNGFVHFGMGNSGAKDNYVYVVGNKVGDANNTYLARVPKTGLDNSSLYEWYAGGQTNPNWGSWPLANAIHTDSNGGNGGTAIYDNVIGRYILLQGHGTGLMRQFAMYEATELWGPWKTIFYSENWGGSYGATIGYGKHIVEKWSSADHKTFWMSFSGGSEAGPDYDALNLVQGTFVLAADIPSPPIIQGVGSYLYGPYLYGTMQ